MVAQMGHEAGHRALHHEQAPYASRHPLVPTSLVLLVDVLLQHRDLVQLEVVLHVRSRELLLDAHAALRGSHDVRALLREPDVLTAVLDARYAQHKLVPQHADRWGLRVRVDLTGLFLTSLLPQTGAHAVHGLVDDRHGVAHVDDDLARIVRQRLDDVVIVLRSTDHEVRHESPREHGWRKDEQILEMTRSGHSDNRNVPVGNAPLVEHREQLATHDERNENELSRLLVIRVQIVGTRFRI